MVTSPDRGWVSDMLSRLARLGIGAWPLVLNLHRAQRRAQRRRHPVLKVQAA